MKKILLIFILVLALISKSNFLLAQTDDLTGYFRSPLDIPLKAAAYFGDVRTNHFHSGLDLRTEQVEGKNVYAVADGYISRIRVSATGFGYALYIAHPNGYTTLYGHLQRYNNKISEYISGKQYEKESFEIDYFPEKNELPVKKGDVIALSGNSGGSEGPHLHFEVRDSKTEQIINPLLCGFLFRDHTPPVIKKVMLYAHTSTGEWQEILNLPVSGSNGKYHTNVPIPLHIYGEIGIGISSDDLDDVSGGPNGFYSAELIYDGKRIFHQEMDRFSFSETRYVNASIDYPRRITTKEIVQRCFLLPGNKMSIFKDRPLNGIMNISDSNYHSAEIILLDKSGNTASMKLFFMGDPQARVIAKEKNIPAAIFPYNQPNTFRNEKMILELPEGILYDTLLLEYNSKPGGGKYFSDIFHIHNPNTPVHNNYTLSVSCEVPGKYQNKALMVAMEEKNRVYAQGGKYENGFLTASLRTFGDFTVMIDTTAPRITAQNFPVTKNLSGAAMIRFRISDNLSGIKSYRGTMDGIWIRMEFDAKTSMLTYYFDKPLASGKHKLKVVVTDKVDNTGVFETDLVR